MTDTANFILGENLRNGKIWRAPTATVHLSTNADVRCFNTAHDPTRLILSTPINIDAGSFVLWRIRFFLLMLTFSYISLTNRMYSDFFSAKPVTMSGKINVDDNVIQDVEFIYVFDTKSRNLLYYMYE